MNRSSFDSDLGHFDESGPGRRLENFRLIRGLPLPFRRRGDECFQHRVARPFVAPHPDLRRDELEARQPRLSTEDVQGGEHGLEPLTVEDRLSAELGSQFAKRRGPGEDEPRLAPGRLQERQCELRVQPAGFQPRRSRDRDVREVVRQVQVGDVQVQGRLMRPGKRLRRAVKGDGSAVDLGFERRLSSDLYLRRNVREKRDPDGDVANRVLLSHRPVVEVHTAAFDPDVVEREAERFLLRGLWFRRFVQEVLDVVSPVLVAHERDRRLRERDLASHGSTLQQRDRFEVDGEPIEGEEPSDAPLLLDLQSFQRSGKRKRVD